jgi:GNAT superfamily N-acetyltransferase
MIREARAADIPRLIEIRAAVRENRLRSVAIGADDYLPYLADARCWVWQADGAIQGFAALDADAASVWALFVAPDAEGQRAGRNLLERLIADARSRGLAALTLDTEAGTRAEAFYRAAGWTITGRDDHGSVRMALTL